MSTTVIVILAFIGLGLLGFIPFWICVIRRCCSWLKSRNMVSTLPQHRQQSARQNSSRHPNRSGPSITYQPVGEPTRVTPIVQTRPTLNNPLYQSHPAAAEPFLPITPPERVRPPIPEHGHPNFTLDLKERMRQVQTMMLEIHRLENEPGNHRQRIHELQRRVEELSDTTPGTTTDAVGQYQVAGVGTSELPPAYVP